MLLPLAIAIVDGGLLLPTHPTRQQELFNYSSALTGKPIVILQEGICNPRPLRLAKKAIQAFREIANFPVLCRRVLCMVGDCKFPPATVVVVVSGKKGALHGGLQIPSCYSCSCCVGEEGCSAWSGIANPLLLQL